MADTKLVDLTAIGTPTTDDLLYLVDDPSGTPLDRKMTIAQLQALISGRVLIEEQSPTGTNVTFSSLGAYTHLEIWFSARGDTAATSTPLLLQFNGDTGANYDRQFLAGSAAVASAAEVLGATSAEISAIAAASASAGMPTTGTIEIHDYRGTTFQKNAIASMNLRRSSASGNVFARTYSVGWLSTAAITSISLTLTAGNFVAGSKFSLYGVK